MTDTGPYLSAKPLFGTLPTWIADPLEQQRIASYGVYENIYGNVPTTFKLTSRGAEDNPIYVPTGKQIVETMHRYLAPKLAVIPDPLFGTPNDQLLASQVWVNFSRRERFYSRFNASKRYGIIRGDWVIHFYGDPLREPGAKLSLFFIDPGSCFPVYNPENIDEIIGWDIADQYIDSAGKLRVRKLSYRKTTLKAGPSPITVEEKLYEVDKWGGPGQSEDEAVVTEVTKPLITLPSPIDQLPVYLIQNFETPGDIWGRSEMQGLERIMAAINQSVSDEEIALALEGLGVYWTDAGTPVDPETGADAPWNLGPGRVAELPTDKKLYRLNGVRTVTPMQDHLKYLHQQIDGALGMSPVAKGNVDVTIAESGIALMLELGPILARAEEKEITVTDVLTNMLYDFSKWIIAYEGTAFNSLFEVTRWIPKYGDKLPPNQAQEVGELVTLHQAKLLPSAYVRDRLRKLRYSDMPDEAAIAAAIAVESAAAAQLQQDAFGARAEEEMGTEDTDLNA